MENYFVVNKDFRVEYNGKAKAYRVQAALDLYDSLGGADKGFAVVNVDRLTDVQKKDIKRAIQLEIIALNESYTSWKDDREKYLFRHEQLVRRINQLEN